MPFLVDNSDVYVIPHRIGGRTNPAARDDELSEIGEDATVIRYLQIGLLRGRIADCLSCKHGVVRRHSDRIITDRECREV